MNEIKNLEVKDGSEYIRKFYKEEYDKDMIHKIDLFSAQGIDVRKIKSMNDFLNQTQSTRFELLEQKFKNKLDKKKKPDSEIDKIISSMALKKKYGK